MTRTLRTFGVGFAVVFAIALAWSPWAQEARRAAASALDKRGRDLAMAAPESVGIASDRLKRLDSVMARLVEQKQVAGLVTLLERHGKVVEFNAVGKLD